MSTTVRIALIGIGAVNRSLLQLLEKKASIIEQQYGLRFQVTLIADSSGVAHHAEGFSLHQLFQLKAEGGQVSQLRTALPLTQLTDLLHLGTCDLLFEGTPVDIKSGEPGLTVTRRALTQGITVVLANKGPLIHHFSELSAIAQTHGAGLGYSATVCGGLPVINIGQRDLVAAQIHKLRGIFNSTTNYILAQMEKGHSFAAALAEAQQRGIAEADPTLDIDGWDTANKLVILANSVLGLKVGLDDVEVQGIRHVTTEQLRHAKQEGETIKLLATAQRSGSGYAFSVAPTQLPKATFLGSCDGWEMGIEFVTDIYGTLYHKSWEETPTPTAAAMLRDAISLLYTSSAIRSNKF